MSDEKAPAGQEAGAAAPKKKLSGKTIVLFIVLPALLLLGGGGMAALLLFSGPKPEAHAKAESGHGKAAKADEHGGGESEHAEGGRTSVSITEGEGVYFLAAPDLLVNISTADGRPAYLKLRLTLESDDRAAIEAVEPQMPRILDQFQSLLRELRVDDLTGSAGAYRLRLELLRRVNLAIAPHEVDAVLIEEMLVQ